MLNNQYLFASVLLVAAGSRSPLPSAEPPADVVADMKGAVAQSPAEIGGLA